MVGQLACYIEKQLSCVGVFFLSTLIDGGGNGCALYQTCSDHKENMPNLVWPSRV
jgi:hypothetical protein